MMSGLPFSCRLEMDLAVSVNTIVFTDSLLDDLGFQHVPIYAPNQDETLYRDLGILSSRFARWMAGDCGSGSVDEEAP